MQNRTFGLLPIYFCGIHLKYKINSVRTLV